jgi:hypothetical protein
MARGRSASIARFVTTVRDAASITNTALVRAQEIHARRGVPANTRSLGSAGVCSEAMTLRAATSTTLIEDEM